MAEEQGARRALAEQLEEARRQLAHAQHELSAAQSHAAQHERSLVQVPRMLSLLQALVLVSAVLDKAEQHQVTACSMLIAGLHIVCYCTQGGSRLTEGREMHGQTAG